MSRTSHIVEKRRDYQTYIDEAVEAPVRKCAGCRSILSVRTIYNLCSHCQKKQKDLPKDKKIRLRVNFDTDIMKVVDITSAAYDIEPETIEGRGKNKRGNVSMARTIAGYFLLADLRKERFKVAKVFDITVHNCYNIKALKSRLRSDEKAVSVLTELRKSFSSEVAMSRN